jgi:hypothetical protein
MPHGLLNKLPIVRIVVKYQGGGGGGGISSSPGTLIFFPLNTTLGGIDVVIIKSHRLKLLMTHGTLEVPHGTLSGECK